MPTLRWSLRHGAEASACPFPSGYLQSWALAHPSPQVLSFLGTQVSTLYSEFEHTLTQVHNWMRNWARKLNFLGASPALDLLATAKVAEINNINNTIAPKTYFRPSCPVNICVQPIQDAFAHFTALTSSWAGTPSC